MSERGTLLNGDEAIHVIEQIADPVTRNLVNLAYVSVVKRIQVTRSDRPQTDLDALFLVRALRDFFGDHDTLSRTLAGETVGAWFTDEAP